MIVLSPAKPLYIMHYLINESFLFHRNMFYLSLEHLKRSKMLLKHEEIRIILEKSRAEGARKFLGPILGISSFSPPEGFSPPRIFPPQNFEAPISLDQKDSRVIRTISWDQVLLLHASASPPAARRFGEK